jgi:alkylhydroperoxidase family enzyme
VLTQAVLRDYRTAPIDERLRAALTLLERFVLRPDELGPADISNARQAGLSDVDIRDALYVSTLFSIIDRLADSFRFDVPSQVSLRKSAAGLLKRGYALPLPLRLGR